MRIRPKTQLAFLIIGLLPLLGTGWFSLHQAGETLGNHFIEQLNSLASIQKKRIESIIVQDQERLNLVRSRTQLRINLSRHNQDPLESHRRSMLRILNDAKQSIPSFRTLSVIDLNGTIIVSTNPNQIGRDVSNETFFREGLHHAQASTFSTDTNGNLITLLSGPLILETTVGVLLIESSAEGYLSITRSYEGLGNSGETILLLHQDNAVRHLTPLRFNPAATLQPVTTQSSPDELLGNSFAVDGGIAFRDAVDYRGNHVLAASHHIDLRQRTPDSTLPADSVNNASRSISLITKIDHAEAFAPIIQLKNMGIIFIVITLVAVLIASFLLSNSITRPLLNLAKTVTEISDGNLDKRAHIEGNNEISFLARDFNSMARKLTEANRHLEDKIAERTAQLETIRERYALAVQGSTDGLWDWNTLTNTVNYSDRFKELLGYEPHEFEDTFASFESRLHPDDKGPTLDAVKAHLEHKKPYDVEYRLHCKDDTYRWFRARGKAIRDSSGKATRMAGSISDVTDRHLALEKLKQSNRDLEQFAYVASHDLQEPLRMISSYISLIDQRYRDQLDATAQEFIDFAIDGANRMQKLIEDLLHYSRVGTRSKPLTPTSSEEALQTAIAHLGKAIEDRSASVTHDPLPTISGDVIQLTQLFQNLIGNAIKFCPAERTPTIHISAEDEGTRWLFRVRDNGIGIEHRNRDAIFEIFRRLHTADEYEGTGIGLSVCQKIVHRHGGRIWVESEPNQGSTFCFTLPKQPSPS